MNDYSVKELMACWLSRDLVDGEFAAVGANFPIPRAAVLLAHFLHGPNMTISMGAFRIDLEGVNQVMTLKYFSDYRPVRWARSAAYFPIDLFCWSRLDVFFISGIQIDAHGNTNLIGIPSDDGRYKFRGPGSIGTTTLASLAGRYYIVTEHHTPRLFVEKCSLTSALGFGDGSLGLREKLHLPGQGPKYCVTPLCVFDFSPTDRRMRLWSLHPGVSLGQVRENTGFDFEVPENTPVTEAPTPEELDVLRRRVDPEGLLRT